MKVSFLTWVNSLGMLAGTFVSVNAGTELARIDSIADGYSRGRVLSLAGLTILSWLFKEMERLVPSWYLGAE